MPNIPQDPLLSSAAIYEPPISAQPSSICKPASEGLKFLAMQFAYAVNSSFSVNMTNAQGSPQPALSKVAAAYVDNSRCENDVIIYFPDTGFRVKVAAHEMKMCPVITNNPIMVVANTGANTLSVPTDITDIIVLNQYMPEFNSNFLPSVENKGLGSSGISGFDSLVAVLSPEFVTCGAIFPAFLTTDGTTQDWLTGTQWFLDSVIAGGVAHTNDASVQTGILFLEDNGVIFGEYPFVVSGATTQQNIQIINQTGIKYKSESASGNKLQTRIIGLNVNAVCLLTLNGYGGILIP